MTLLPPSPELQVLIRRELNEDPETREASLQAIKDWLAIQPHLPDTWDETGLLNFLRGCNFSLEKCKQKLDFYFTIRARLPEFYANRDLRRPEIQEVIKYGGSAVLPTLTPEGRRVIFLLIKEKVSKQFSLEVALKATWMAQDIRLVEEKFGVVGDIYVFDSANITAAVAAQFTPSLAKKTFVNALKAYPIKMKEFHVLNVHPVMEMLFKAVKHLLKEKIVQRVHFHTNGYESLYKFVPRHILPVEYGGNGGYLRDLNNEWLKKLEEYTSWFEEQEKLQADESKRPIKLTDSDEIFGIEGSFKQFNID